MPKTCLNVFTNCTDPAREDEFNRWYTHTHLPDLSQSYGFLCARRFINRAATDDTAKFYAQYEFDTDDPSRSMLSLLEQAMSAFKGGRHIDCIIGSTPAQGAIWEQIDPSLLAPLDETKMDYPKAPPDYLRDAIEAMQATYSED